LGEGRRESSAYAREGIKGGAECLPQKNREERGKRRSANLFATEQV